MLREKDIQTSVKKQLLTVKSELQPGLCLSYAPHRVSCHSFQALSAGIFLKLSLVSHVHALFPMFW